MYKFILRYLSNMSDLSVESQKGINDQRCTVENQKGAIAVQSLWWKYPSGFQWNIVEQC